MDFLSWTKIGIMVDLCEKALCVHERECILDIQKIPTMCLITTHYKQNKLFIITTLQFQLENEYYIYI